MVQTKTIFLASSRMFASPILQALIGPVTNYVLKRFQ